MTRPLSTTRSPSGFRSKASREKVEKREKSPVAPEVRSAEKSIKRGEIGLGVGRTSKFIAFKVGAMQCQIEGVCSSLSTPIIQARNAQIFEAIDLGLIS
jgi:ribose 5-phosphate isomerase